MQAELYVNYDNGQKLSVHKFSFEIDRALVDQDIVPVAEYYIEDFEDLKAVIVEMSDEAELMLTELQKKFETLDNIETKEGAQEKADAAEANANAYTDAHAAKTNNPHKVTKAQVGLSNVDNVKQASKTEFDSHVNDTSNPHDVTKAQIGLSNVDDVQQASKKNLMRMTTILPGISRLMSALPGTLKKQRMARKKKRIRHWPTPRRTYLTFRGLLRLCRTGGLTTTVAKM